MAWNKPNVGEIFKSNFGTEYEVLEYLDCYNVKIKFLDSFGYEGWFQADAVRRGGVSNPFDKTVHGVGYTGVGDSATVLNKTRLVEREAWFAMMARGYCPKLKAKHPKYADCTVSEDWHCYQNFANWMKNQRFYGLGYQLDKDLLVKDNKIYSPETCILLPSYINQLIQRDIKKIGTLPKGVDQVSKNNFRAVLKTLGDTTRVSGFGSPEDAYVKYKEMKEEYVKSVADLWFGNIDARAYKALYEWEL